MEDALIIVRTQIKFIWMENVFVFLDITKLMGFVHLVQVTHFTIVLLKLVSKDVKIINNSLMVYVNVLEVFT
jgi:hypothetical protein